MLAATREPRTASRGPPTSPDVPRSAANVATRLNYPNSTVLPNPTVIFLFFLFFFHNERDTGNHRRPGDQPVLDCEQRTDAHSVRLLGGHRGAPAIPSRVSATSAMLAGQRAALRPALRHRLNRGIHKANDAKETIYSPCVRVPPSPQQRPPVLYLQSLLHNVPRPLQCWCGAASHQHCIR